MPVVYTGTKQVSEGVLSRIQGALNHYIHRTDQNEQEAYTAYKIAQDLLLKYHLDEKDFRNTQQAGADSISDQESVYTSPRKQSWVTMLATTIAKNFRCVNYTNQRWDDEIQMNLNDTMMVGTKVDREAAMMVFYAAVDTIELLEKGKRSKKDYRFGFIHGLSEYFRSHYLDMPRNMQLMVITPESVNIFMEDMKKKSRQDGFVWRTSRPKVRINHGSNDYKAGRTDGRNWKEQPALRA